MTHLNFKIPKADIALSGSSAFLQGSKKLMEIKTRIEATDCKIDQLVYTLYGLTEEEIGIVEG